MWNSPRRTKKTGIRYDIRDIAVLTHPLDQMMDFLGSSSVEDVVHERILCRMDKDELTFAIYEVLRALLEDDPIPKKGHTGYQEAIVAELLYQTQILIGCELDMDEKPLNYARAAAWQSVVRLRAPQPKSRREVLWQLDDLKLNLNAPKIFRSPKITFDHWEALLLAEGGLWDEFLWDDDWRMDIACMVMSSAKRTIVGDREEAESNEVAAPQAGRLDISYEAAGSRLGLVASGRRCESSSRAPQETTAASESRPRSSRRISAQLDGTASSGC